MSDRLSALEARVAELSESLRQMQGRIAALERGGGASPATRRRTADPAACAAAGEPTTSDAAAVTATLSFIGRTLLVLAGAFLLRALTDAGTVPTSVGVALGFVYAATWIVMADCAGRVGRRSSAGFHGAASMLIAVPLLFEAMSRFRLLSPPMATTLLALFTAAALGVAAHRRLHALAWVAALGGIPPAVMLMLVTGRLAPPLLYLVGLGIATLWLGYVLDWMYVRWPVAVVADLAAVVLALRAVAPGAAEGPGTALSLQLALTALYIGSIATRTLFLHRDVLVFEVVQTAAVIVVGLGGASFVVLRSGIGAGVLGAMSLAFGLAGYAVAFAFLDRREQNRTNFYFYTSVSIVFVMAGTILVLSGSALAIAAAALAVIAGALGRRLRRRTLATHGAIYAVGGAIASGLIGHAADAVLASPALPWAGVSPAALAVMAAMAGTAWLTAIGPAGPTAVLERVARVLLLGVLAAVAAGVAIGWLAPIFAGTSGGGARAGAVATVRTGVLAAGVLLLAWVSRLDAWAEASWLVYPVLAAIGLKIVLEDVERSRPAMLVLAFAAYGAALILAPRLRRRDAGARPAGSAGT